MNLINFSQPLLCKKQLALDFQDLQGLWRINGKIGNITLISGFYTRIDQAFILWGLIAAGIFSTAQFLPISWHIQAILWSALTIIGTICMVVLTWFWVSVERLRWVVYCWVILMLIGLTITDLGIFFSRGEVLMQLCPLWLLLSAIGYFCTGVGLRSRTFFLMGFIHLLCCAILPLFSAWQFLATGIVMAMSLLLLSELQWDMRRPINYDRLTPQQKQFNQQQYRLRQMSA